MEKRIEELALMLKKGSKIHIKKENRGKFTDYCGGKVTSECISRGKNSPDPKIRKRATFAANARKWKHADGGTIDGDVSFEGIKTTNNRPYNPVYISYINTKLRDGGMGKNQRLAVLSNIIEESGGDPFAEGPGGFYGLLQWSPQRYKKTGVKNVYEELDNQINYILNTVGNATDRMSWTHGGKGSGYNSLTDAMDAFNGDDLTASMRGFTLGYVRPAGGLDSLAHRMAVLNQINSIQGFYKKGGRIQTYATGDPLVYNPFKPTDKNTSKESKPTQGSPYGSFTYTPLSEDSASDLIYDDFKPSFNVEPVNIVPIRVKKKSVQTNVNDDEPEDIVDNDSSEPDLEPTFVPTSASVKYSRADQSKFAKDMYNLYYTELSKRGIPNPSEYAEWLTAQDALETLWGASTIGNNNFGNIQYFDELHSGKYSYTAGTDKHKNGKKYSAKFVNFDTIEDYIKYKVRMMSNQNSKRYKDIFKGNVNGFADRMQASGYAEDPRYAKLLKDVLASVKTKLV